MKTTFCCLALLLSLPLAAGKPFAKTSDYSDPKVLKGYLNVKFDTYSNMYQWTKGTDCDWVFVDPSFKMDDLRGQNITLYPDAITRNGGFDPTYWGMASNWYANGIVSTFESSLRTRGLSVTHPAALSATQMRAYAMAATSSNQATPAAKPTDPPALTALQQQIELDRYADDKAKFGLEEAVRRAEDREAKRKAEWKAQVEQADEQLKPKNPEEAPGWNLVVYLTEANVHAGAAMWIPLLPVTNTTTGEFVLLRDGKPVLAGRHCSVGAYTASGPKCGNALATAFDVKNTL